MLLTFFFYIIWYGREKYVAQRRDVEGTSYHIAYDMVVSGLLWTFFFYIIWYGSAKYVAQRRNVEDTSYHIVYDMVDSGLLCFCVT